MAVTTTKRRPSEDLAELAQQLLRELKILETESKPEEPELYLAYLQYALSLTWKGVSRGDFGIMRKLLDHLQDARPFVDTFLPESQDHRTEAAREINFALRMLYLAEESLADAQLLAQLADQRRSHIERAVLQVLWDNRGRYLRRNEVQDKLRLAEPPTPAPIGQILVDFHYQGLARRIQAPVQDNSSAAFYALSEKGLVICQQLGLDKQTAPNNRLVLKDLSIALLKDLSIALKKQDQFVLHYQLQKDIEERIIGAEVLLRWKHPQFDDLLLAKHFIKRVDNTEEIILLDEWVLAHVCQQLKDDSFPPDFRLAINISSHYFRQNNFVSQVKRTVQQSGVDPNRLALEIPVDVVTTCKRDDIIKKMNDLKAFGVHPTIDKFDPRSLSIDDLQKLPVDLKMDESWVQDSASDNNTASSEKTVASASAQGKKVIAPWVQTPQQFKFLKDMTHPPAIFQGSHFGYPVSKEDFVRTMNRAA